jgi:hypothetical protein
MDKISSNLRIQNVHKLHIHHSSSSTLKQLTTFNIVSLSSTIFAYFVNNSSMDCPSCKQLIHASTHQFFIITTNLLRLSTPNLQGHMLVNVRIILKIILDSI